MKGLDTPILLDLLRGAPAARALIRSLGAEELATTELNLFELEALARLDPAPGRERRLSALDKLRGRLTVVPIDGRSTAAARAYDTRSRLVPWASRLVFAALDAAGCSEVYSAESVAPSRPGGPRIRRYKVGRTARRT